MNENCYEDDALCAQRSYNHVALCAPDDPRQMSGRRETKTRSWKGKNQMETITRYNANGMPYKTEMSKEEAMLLVHTMAHSFLLHASNPLFYPVNTKERGETAWLVVERLLKTQEEDPAAERDSLKAQNAELVRILEAALERMEAVSERIGVENRSEGVSQRAHVCHMAAHLAQHAKIARADLAKARGQA